MPSFSDPHVAAKAIKLMLIGNSGCGKTGALLSLVQAGYKLRIVDMDSGLDALYNLVKQNCPERLGQIGYMTFRDSYKATAAGPIVRGAPKAAVNALNALDKWEDGTIPENWGPEYVLVLDSLTLFGQAAFAWAKQMNPAVKEKRQWYQAGQELIQSTIATLTSDSFTPNVIVISHVDIRTAADGTIKGWPSALGEALGDKLPAYFNMLLVSETSGSGTTVKRQIKTVPTALIDAKNPAPFKISAVYPIETALASIFEALRK